MDCPLDIKSCIVPSVIYIERTLVTQCLLLCFPFVIKNYTQGKTGLAEGWKKVKSPSISSRPLGPPSSQYYLASD